MQPDHTNASRTLFFNLHSLQWDEELTATYGLTGIHLPKLKPSSSSFGRRYWKDCLRFLFPLPLLSAIPMPQHSKAVLKLVLQRRRWVPMQHFNEYRQQACSINKWNGYYHLLEHGKLG
jgi:hypothetical protein